MTEQRDPVRWLDDPTLAGSLREELEQYAADRPSVEGRARMLAGLSRDLGLPDASLPNVSKQLSEGATRATLGKLKLALGSLAMLAGAVVLVALWPSRPSVPHAAPAPAARAPRSVELAAEQVSPAPVADVPSVDTEAASVPAVPAFALHAPIADVPLVPRARNKLKRVSPPRELSPRVVETTPESDLSLVLPASPLVTKSADPVAELQLLAQARRALLSQPAHALEFTEQHARDYPQGTFSEEREVLAIESLHRLGLSDEVQRRVRAFEQSFPNSAQRAHLARMMQSPRP